jgi:predicted restriction endonuclease
VFKFNSEYYKQDIGLSMGFKTSPSASDIVVYHYGKDWIEQFKQYIHTYKRYRDDIFLIWTRSESILQQFMEMSNNLADRLKFDFCVSHDQVDFLDLKIYKVPRFQNKVY